MPTEPEAARPSELIDYLGVLKRQWLSVLCVVAAGLLAAAVLLVALPKSYLATAAVHVNPLPGQGDTPVSGSRVTDGVNLDTEAQLLTSSVVTDRARRLLRTNDSDRTLQRRVSVSVPPNSAVLDIDYRASSRRAAAAGANAFARAYLANRRETAVSGQAAQIAIVQHQLDEVAGELRDLARQLARLPSRSPQRDLLVAQQNVLSFRVTNLDDRLVTLQADNPSAGQLITPAKRPSGADTPKPVLYLPAGGLAGLLIGLAVAVLRDQRPRRMRRARDVERLLGLEVLADLPRPAPPAATASYQRLGTDLIAILGRTSWSLLITAPTPGSSAGSVAENLAQSLARAGARVTLVPGDGAGTGGGQPSGSSRGSAGDPGDHNAGVLRSAVRADMPLAEQLQVARPGGLLEELRTASEIVVLSVPPVLAGPDAQALAPLLDGVLLAVALGTPTRGAREAVHRLRRAHARLLGVVVLRAEPAGESRPRDFASVPLEGGQRHRQSSNPTGHEAGARTRAP